MQRETLLLVLADVRALVSLSGNDFSYSSFVDAESALAELDAAVARIGQGALPVLLAVWFLPTGPLQELALSSGWGDAFIEVAERFDRACAGEGECGCLTPPFFHEHFRSTYVGVDPSQGRFADVSLETCRACGQRFVHYRYELEAFARSGRWYRAPVTSVEAGSLEPGEAPWLVARAPCYFYGGSYFETTGKRGQAALDPARL